MNPLSCLGFLIGGALIGWALAASAYATVIERERERFRREKTLLLQNAAALKSHIHALTNSDATAVRNIRQLTQHS